MPTTTRTSSTAKSVMRPARLSPGTKLSRMNADGTRRAKHGTRGRNIRNAANRRKDDLQDDPDYSPFAALYAVFCGVRRFPRYKDLLHLADLIDRPTTTRHGKFKTKYGRETPCCEVCGYSIGDMRWNHCPKCGAAIVDD